MESNLWNRELHKSIKVDRLALKREKRVLPESSISCGTAYLPTPLFLCFPARINDLNDSNSNGASSYYSFHARICDLSVYLCDHIMVGPVYPY